MMEAEIISFLSERLPCPVYMEEPEDSPGTFVLVQKTGGGRSNHICSAAFAVQSYAGSLHEAALLNEEAKEAMDCLTELDSVASARLNTDYAFMDTSKKRPRYQAVYDIVHY